MLNTYQQLMFELIGEVAVKHLAFIGRRPVDVAQVVQAVIGLVFLLKHLIQFQKPLGVYVSLAVISSR